MAEKDTTPDVTETDGSYKSVNGIEVEDSGDEGGLLAMYDNTKDFLRDWEKRRENEKEIFPAGMMGAPPLMNNLADPKARVYVKYLLADAHTITFIPGKPKFFRAKTSNDEVYRAEEATEKLGGLSDDQASIAKFLTSNFRNAPDFRYYGFEQDMQSFTSYVNMLTNMTFLKLKAFSSNMEADKSFANMNDEYKGEDTTTGVTFFLNKGTTVTEVASNDFGPSKLEGISKTASGLFKELKFLLGNTKGEQTAEELGKQNEAVQSQLNSIMDTGGVMDSMLGLGNIGGVDKMQTVVNGSHLLFPHVWNDSVFDRTYNIVFKFTSPYGDAMSVWRSVIVPFVTLLTFALPRQDTYMGYFAPFILRVDAPGILMSDMAVITSMSWKKGGSDDSFTKDGLPLEMEVTLSVRDLYPVLMMSPTYNSMKASNMGLAYFMDNLVGIGVQDFATTFSTIEYMLASRLSPVYNIGSKLKAWFDDNILKGYIGFLRSGTE